MAQKAKQILRIARATFKRPPQGILSTLPHARYTIGDTIICETTEQADELVAYGLAGMPQTLGMTQAGKLTPDGTDFEAEYAMADDTLIVRFGEKGKAAADGTWHEVGDDGHVGRVRKAPETEPTPLPTPLPTETAA